MRARFALAVLAFVLAAPAQATQETLGAQYKQNAARLQNNAYGRPLVLESVQGKNTLTGEAWLRIDRPYAQVSEALHDPAHWCEILLLPFNVKQCSAGPAHIGLNVGRKSDQELEDTYRLDFAWAPNFGDDYFQVDMKAAEGPVGTRDYQILLEAMPVEEGKTFLHFSYSYGYGMASRLATQAYFATSARGKVGFTTVTDDGSPHYVGGLRGAIERNAMRYTLAIESFLAVAASPAGSPRFESAAAQWFDATERYARQLHEMDRPEYLAMKKKEYLRQTVAHAQVAQNQQRE